MKLTLGRAPAGSNVDLDALLHAISSDLGKLSLFSEKFLRDNPEWQQAASDATREYSVALEITNSFDFDEDSAKWARQMGLSQTQFLLANGYALLAFLGLSHFLKWAGFDIRNPASFREMSTKLLFARKYVFSLGVRLAASKLGSVSVSGTSSGTIPSPMNKTYEQSFGLGAALGYLITYAHLNSPMAAEQLLDSG